LAFSELPGLYAPTHGTIVLLFLLGVVMTTGGVMTANGVTEWMVSDRRHRVSIRTPEPWKSDWYGSPKALIPVDPIPK
jgi:hypothetical protein